jgi:predicted Rossmann fold nucleotide-binding protein DprA/Smf involved in DNA uptake
VSAFPVITISPEDSIYPPSLKRWLGEDAPVQLSFIGNIEILKQHHLGLFSSVKCPASLILKAHDLAQKLAEAGTPVISGFHSPVEKEVLSVLLQGAGSIAICLARGLEGMRVPSEYHKPLEDGRLVLVSFLGNTIRRPKVEFSYERNRLVTALAERILVLHAEQGGKLESLCQELVGWDKPIYTIKDTSNENPIHLGVLEWKA